MKVIMLAAGVGSRLYGSNHAEPPKALLRFDGKTLLHRHIDILKACGVDELALVVGYRKEDLLAEVANIGATDFVTDHFNPRFTGGPMISLWTARHVLRSGERIVFMDADVLYHPAHIERLISSAHHNCFLVDRDIEDGDDPVRVCVKDGHPVDFGKAIEGDFDFIGEWPGFMSMDARIAARVADATQAYMDADNTDLTYEWAMRDVLISEPAGTFGVEDISGIPWVEIDFPEDLERAKKVIMPLLPRDPLAAD
jgi:choline kinase